MGAPISYSPDLCGSPSSITAAFVVVPPMSKVSRFGVDSFFERCSAPETPATGPDSSENTGRSPARCDVIIPPLDCITSIGASIPIAETLSRSDRRYVFITGIR